jgi:hypothetical protein
MKMEWKPRERRLALSAGVLIACWGLLSWLIQPLWERAREGASTNEGQIEKLDAMTRLLVQSPTIERSYAAVAGYFEGDDERAQGSFLDALELMSQETGVRLNLKPRPVKREEKLSRFEVELDVEGSQETLMAFLDALFRMPKLMSVERLRIFTVPAKADTLRASLVIQRLSFSP